MSDKEDLISPEKFDAMKKEMNKILKNPSDEDRNEVVFYLDDDDIIKMKERGFIDYGTYPDDNKHYKIVYARKKEGPVNTGPEGFEAHPYSDNCKCFVCEEERNNRADWEDRERHACEEDLNG